MSLRKCPDCYKDVSSSASSCPHCGRPSKKSHLPSEILGGLSIAFICVVALAWHSGSGDDEASGTVTSSTPPETAIARPYQLEQSLSAFIGYNRTLHIFRVENRDTFPWTNCQFSLNSHGISGYELQVESIKPGLTDAALLQSAEFADPDGKKFDPSTDKVATLDLDCETTHGRLYYRGKFGLESSANRASSAERNAAPSADGAIAYAVNLISHNWGSVRRLAFGRTISLPNARFKSIQRQFSAVAEDCPQTCRRLRWLP